MDEQGFRYQVVSIDGDLIFVVGKQRGRIRVSSTVMKQASPYFEKLLGPHFKEGRLLEANTEADKRPRIMLPEDDFDAFWLAADILHGEVHEAAKPSAKELEDLSVLLDKCELTDAVTPVVSTWLMTSVVECTQLLPQIQEDKHTAKLVETAKLAIWLHEPLAFHNATKEIIKQTRPPFCKVMTFIDDDALRDCLALKLEQVRCVAFAKIYNKLIHGLGNYLVGLSKTNPLAIQEAADNIKSLEVRKLEKRSIWSLRTDSLSFLSPPGSQENPASIPPIERCHFCRHAGIDGEMAHALGCVGKMLEDKILALDGLCLGCFYDYVESQSLGSGDKLHHAKACEKIQ